MPPGQVLIWGGTPRYLSPQQRYLPPGPNRGYPYIPMPPGQVQRGEGVPQGTYPFQILGEGVPQGTYPPRPRYLPPCQVPIGGRGYPKVPTPPPPPGPNRGDGVPKVPTPPPANLPRCLTPPPPRGDRTAYGVLDTLRSVCLCVHAGGLSCSNEKTHGRLRRRGYHLHNLFPGDYWRIVHHSSDCCLIDWGTCCQFRCRRMVWDSGK